MNYQAITTSPFAKLGIRCSENELLGITFLPANTALVPPANALAHETCLQLAGYLADSSYRFDLPLQLHGTDHQIKVWQALGKLPSGRVQTYGELAKQLHSSPRAIGQACGNNPIPIVVPCHRIVGKRGLGGFMLGIDAFSLNTKHWLLHHEQC